MSFRLAFPHIRRMKNFPFYLISNRDSIEDLWYCVKVVKQSLECSDETDTGKVAVLQWNFVKDIKLCGPHYTFFFIVENKHTNKQEQENKSLKHTQILKHSSEGKIVSIYGMIQRYSVVIYVYCLMAWWVN